MSQDSLSLNVMLRVIIQHGTSRDHGAAVSGGTVVGAAPLRLDWNARDVDWRVSSLHVMM
eukprot:1140662-Pelagomonas_calceolata.AAC.2